MPKQKLILTAGLVAGLAFSGAVFSPESTYATATPEETAAVASVINQLKPVYQDLIDDYNASLTPTPTPTPTVTPSPTPTATPTSNPNELHLVEENNDSFGPLYKAPSMNVYIDLDQATSLIVKTADDTETYALNDHEDAIISALTSAGFTAYGPANIVMSIDQQYLNEETGVLCEIHGSGAACGHVNWLTISDEWTEYLNGVGAAYYASEGEYTPVFRDGGFGAGSPTIYDSEYEPYQYTAISIAHAIGLFYRSSQTSDWAYFTATQAVLYCSDFTGEAAKGFAGYICWDSTTDTNSKVTVPTDDSTTPTDNSSSDTKKSTTPAIGAPNTGGAPASDNSGAIAILIVSALVPLALAAYALRYARNRAKAKVRFEKH